MNKKKKKNKIPNMKLKTENLKMGFNVIHNDLCRWYDNDGKNCSILDVYCMSSDWSISHFIIIFPTH